MFNKKSNTAFNNNLFSSETIDAMHETMARLYLAAKELKRTEGQTPVAALLGEANPQTLNNWEERGISQRGAIKAQQRIGCSSTWIMSGEGEMMFANPDAAPLIEAEQDAVDGFTIHQYQAGGAMGNGLILEEKQPGIIKSWSVDHEWLRLNVRHHTGVKNLCIVTGFGPSMKPKYNPGDPLLLDRGVTVVDSEGIYFFRVGKHGFIKQLQRIPIEGGLIIRAKSLNDSYDPFDITEKMDFEVFGKVLTVWKSEQV